MLWPWPLTLKNNRVLPLMMVINCTRLYDPGAYSLVVILLTRFSPSKKYYDLWALTLKNNMVLPVMMVVYVIPSCMILELTIWSLSVLPTRYCYDLDLGLKNNWVLPLRWSSIIPSCMTWNLCSTSIGPAYKVFLLSNAMILILDLEKQ
jgi:hypothetical protein